MYRFFRKNREAVKKYLLIFFLSIVSIGMVITLAPIPTGDQSRAEANVLASVDGRNITSQELSETIRTRFQNSQYGYDSRLVPLVASSVLDEMLLQRALLAQAGKLGVEVSDEELSREEQKIPWLYPGGSFVGPERAADLVLQQTGMAPSQFESTLRQSVLMEKLRTVVTDGVQVSQDDLLTEFRHRNTKAKIDYALFDPSQFIKEVKVTPEALEAFFKKDPTRYKLPEQRQVRYALIDPEQARAQVKVDDAELRQFYAQHLSDYRIPDRVKVAHILFKTTGKTPADVATIEKTAADVLNQVRAGGNFEELAKKYSEDTSAAQGGEIGWIVHGQTVKEFESTAFSMKPGTVSGLVKTIYGIHIIKVEDKQTAHLQSFDEVKDAIRTELEKQRASTVQQKLATEIESQVKANPDQFDAVVRKAGLDPKESPLFKFQQAVTDLGNAEAFENLAFQLRPGEVGRPISVPKGEAIIQLARIVPEHAPALDEVKAQVEEDYRHEQSTVLAAEKAKKLAESAKTADFNKAAKALGLTPKESKDFSQSEYVEGLGSGAQLATAFTLDAGKTSDVVTVGGNSVVFRVASHTPANEADFATQRDQIREELLDQRRNLAFEIYRQNLRQQLLRSGELKVNDNAMKQFLASYQTK